AHPRRRICSKCILHRDEPRRDSSRHGNCHFGSSESKWEKSEGLRTLLFGWTSIPPTLGKREANRTTDVAQGVAEENLHAVETATGTRPALPVGEGGIRFFQMAAHH